MDRLEYIKLWDIYKNLLTKTQRGICSLYFEQDLTVSEIAEELSVSRQAVSDCISGCKRALEEYEEATHVSAMLARRDEKIYLAKKDAVEWIRKAAAIAPEMGGQLKKLYEKISEDLSEDPLGE